MQGTLVTDRFDPWAYQDELELFESCLEHSAYFICAHSRPGYRMWSGATFSPDKCVKLLRDAELVIVDTDPVTGKCPRYVLNFSICGIIPDVEQGEDYCSFTFDGKDSQLEIIFYNLPHRT